MDIKSAQKKIRRFSFDTKVKYLTYSVFFLNNVETKIDLCFTHQSEKYKSDYKKTLNYLESKGTAIINSGNYDNIHFSFLDTREHINFITEISDKNLFSENNSRIILHP